MEIFTEPRPLSLVRVRSGKGKGLSKQLLGQQSVEMFCTSIALPLRRESRTDESLG